MQAAEVAEARVEAESAEAEEQARVEYEKLAAAERAHVEAQKTAAEEIARAEAEKAATEEQARVETAKAVAEEQARVKADAIKSRKAKETKEKRLLRSQRKKQRDAQKQDDIAKAALKLAADKSEKEKKKKAKREFRRRQSEERNLIRDFQVRVLQRSIRAWQANVRAEGLTRDRNEGLMERVVRQLQRSFRRKQKQDAAVMKHSPTRQPESRKVPIPSPADLEGVERLTSTSIEHGGKPAIQKADKVRYPVHCNCSC